MSEVNRKLRARQTRARIAASAARLFAERGYLGTPMDAIAAEAGVAVQTVYFAFRTKPELLIAAYDQAVLGNLDTVGAENLIHGL
jgi:AcrR family transcriptional regulator